MLLIFIFYNFYHTFIFLFEKNIQYKKKDKQNFI